MWYKPSVACLSPYMFMAFFYAFIGLLLFQCLEPFCRFMVFTFESNRFLIHDFNVNPLAGLLEQWEGVFHSEQHLGRDWELLMHQERRFVQRVKLWKKKARDYHFSLWTSKKFLYTFPFLISLNFKNFLFIFCGNLDQCKPSSFLFGICFPYPSNFCG